MTSPPSGHRDPAGHGAGGVGDPSHTVPGLHDTHVDVESSAYVPTGHSIQEVAPSVTLVTLPCSQAVHAVALLDVELLNVPVGHAVHPGASTVSSLNWPSGQGMQRLSRHGPTVSST